MSGSGVGDYVLESVIGSGTTATVWKARRGAETVAVKVLHPHLCRDAVIRGRFLREVTLSRRLVHPSIVRVFDVVTPVDPDEPPALVMEYGPGGNLVGWKSRSAEDVKRLAMGVAGALAAAHEQGLVHRDLKPSNILRDATLEFRVCDFGSACVRDSVSLSTSSLFMDAPYYVAPEVFEGHPADPRSDLYSLGAILYEAATGRRARDGVLPRGPEEAIRPDPGPLEAAVGPALAAVVLTLLAPLDTRPADAGRLLRTLERGRAAGVAAMKCCIFCGATMPLAAPLCLACGQVEIGRSRPAAGAGWHLTLRSIREDAVTVEKVTAILRSVSGDPAFELDIMFGDPRYYSREEQKRKRKLPLRLIEQLTEEDARRLCTLLEGHKARCTTRQTSRTRPTRQTPLVRLAAGGRPLSEIPLSLRMGLEALPAQREGWTQGLSTRLVFALYGLEEASRGHELGDLVSGRLRELYEKTRRLLSDLSRAALSTVSPVDLRAEVARTQPAEGVGTSERHREAIRALEKHEQAERGTAEVMARVLRLCGVLEGMTQELRAATPDRESEVRRSLAELEAELRR